MEYIIVESPPTQQSKISDSIAKLAAAIAEDSTYGLCTVKTSCRILSPSFLVSHWSAGFWTFLASHLLKDCANFMPTPEEKRYTHTAPTTLSAIQAANPLLSMHYNTALVIRGNDKNKQLTLLSQRKLAFTARNSNLR
jgi:hypothetical protein